MELAEFVERRQAAGRLQAKGERLAMWAREFEAVARQEAAWALIALGVSGLLALRARRRFEEATAAGAAALAAAGAVAGPLVPTNGAEEDPPPAARSVPKGRPSKVRETPPPP